MGEKFINIRFPFEESQRGFFVEMNQSTKDALKSDLLHLLFTDKGSRYYLPTFGTNLRQFIFEPNDRPTHESIISEIQDSVNNFLPGLTIDDIQVEVDPNYENSAIVSIRFSVGQGPFAESDVAQVVITQ